MPARVAALLCLVLGCKGEEVSPLTTQRDPGLAPMARLNNIQYNNTIEDIFGLRVNPKIRFPADNVVDQFDNNVYNISVSQVRADALFDAALSVGAAAAENATTLTRCKIFDDACINAFIDRAGRQLYRRPLTAQEHAILSDVYHQTPGDLVEDRAAAVVSSLLMSPQFLYRPEVGQPDPVEPGIVALTGPEIATRMAFLIWSSSPDDALIDEALAGTLSTQAGIEEQAWRMMGDDRARRGMRQFITQWVDVRGGALTSKSAEHYPSYSPDLVRSMRQELDLYIDRVVWEEDGSVVDLLTSNRTTIDAKLAEVYGIAHHPSQDWVDVTLPPSQRSGVLTMAAFLTGKSRSITPSLVQRGKYVRETLLCGDIPFPPDNVSTFVDQTSTAETNRERSEVHLTNPACAGCHVSMDPLGYAFENYDAIGQWRNTDNGFPVDATGSVVLGQNEISFTNAMGMLDAIANDDLVLDCMAIHMFRYGYGRRPDPVDDGMNLDRLLADNTRNRGSLQSLMVGLTQTQGFRYRRISQKASP